MDKDKTDHVEIKRRILQTDHLYHTICDITHRIKELEAERTILRQNVQNLTCDYNNIRLENDRLLYKCDDIESKYNILEREHTQLKKLYEKLEDEYKNDVNNLSIKYQSVSAEISTYQLKCKCSMGNDQEKKGTKNHRSEEHGTDVSRLKSQINKLKKELRNREDSHRTELELVTSENNDLRARLECQKSPSPTILELEKELLKKNRELEEAKSIIERLKSDLSKKGSNCSLSPQHNANGIKQICIRNSFNDLSSPLESLQEDELSRNNNSSIKIDYMSNDSLDSTVWYANKKPCKEEATKETSPKADVFKKITEIVQDETSHRIDEKPFKEENVTKETSPKVDVFEEITEMEQDETSHKIDIVDETERIKVEESNIVIDKGEEDSSMDGSDIMSVRLFNIFNEVRIPDLISQLGSPKTLDERREEDLRSECSYSLSEKETSPDERREEDLRSECSYSQSEKETSPDERREEDLRSESSYSQSERGTSPDERRAEDLRSESSYSQSEKETPSPDVLNNDLPSSLNSTLKASELQHTSPDRLANAFRSIFSPVNGNACKSRDQRSSINQNSDSQKLCQYQSPVEKIRRSLFGSGEHQIDHGNGQIPSVNQGDLNMYSHNHEYSSLKQNHLQNTTPHHVNDGTSSVNHDNFGDHQYSPPGQRHLQTTPSHIVNGVSPKKHSNNEYLLPAQNHFQNTLLHSNNDKSDLNYENFNDPYSSRQKPVESSSLHDVNDKSPVNHENTDHYCSSLKRLQNTPLYSGNDLKKSGPNQEHFVEAHRSLFTPEKSPSVNNISMSDQIGLNHNISQSSQEHLQSTSLCNGSNIESHDNYQINQVKIESKDDQKQVTPSKTSTVMNISDTDSPRNDIVNHSPLPPYLIFKHLMISPIKDSDDDCDGSNEEPISQKASYNHIISRNIPSRTDSEVNDRKNDYSGVNNDISPMKKILDEESKSPKDINADNILSVSGEHLNTSCLISNMDVGQVSSDSSDDEYGIMLESLSASKIAKRTLLKSQQTVSKKSYLRNSNGLDGTHDSNNSMILANSSTGISNSMPLQNLTLPNSQYLELHETFTIPVDSLTSYKPKNLSPKDEHVDLTAGSRSTQIITNTGMTQDKSINKEPEDTDLRKEEILNTTENCISKVQPVSTVNEGKKQNPKIRVLEVINFPPGTVWGCEEKIRNSVDSDDSVTGDISFPSRKVKSQNECTVDDLKSHEKSPGISSVKKIRLDGKTSLAKLLQLSQSKDRDRHLESDIKNNSSPNSGILGSENKVKDDIEISKKVSLVINEKSRKHSVDSGIQLACNDIFPVHIKVDLAEKKVANNVTDQILTTLQTKESQMEQNSNHNPKSEDSSATNDRNKKNQRGETNSSEIQEYNIDYSQSVNEKQFGKDKCDDTFSQKDKTDNQKVDIHLAENDQKTANGTNIGNAHTESNNTCTKDVSPPFENKHEIEVFKKDQNSHSPKCPSRTYMREPKKCNSLNENDLSSIENKHEKEASINAQNQQSPKCHIRTYKGKSRKLDSLNENDSFVKNYTKYDRLSQETVNEKGIFNSHMLINNTDTSSIDLPSPFENKHEVEMSKKDQMPIQSKYNSVSEKVSFVENNLGLSQETVHEKGLGKSYMANNINSCSKDSLCSFENKKEAEIPKIAQNPIQAKCNSVNENVPFVENLPKFARLSKETVNKKGMANNRETCSKDLPPPFGNKHKARMSKEVQKSIPLYHNSVDEKAPYVEDVPKYTRLSQEIIKEKYIGNSHVVTNNRDICSKDSPSPFENKNEAEMPKKVQKPTQPEHNSATVVENDLKYARISQETVNEKGIEKPHLVAKNIDICSKDLQFAFEKKHEEKIFQKAQKPIQPKRNSVNENALFVERVSEYARLSQETMNEKGIGNSYMLANNTYTPSKDRPWRFENKHETEMFKKAQKPIQLNHNSVNEEAPIIENGPKSTRLSQEPVNGKGIENPRKVSENTSTCSKDSPSPFENKNDSEMSKNIKKPIQLTFENKNEPEMSKKVQKSIQLNHNSATEKALFVENDLKYARLSQETVNEKHIRNSHMVAKNIDTSKDLQFPFENKNEPGIFRNARKPIHPKRNLDNEKASFVERARKHAKLSQEAVNEKGIGNSYTKTCSKDFPSPFENKHETEMFRKAQKLIQLKDNSINEDSPIVENYPKSTRLSEETVNEKDIQKSNAVSTCSNDSPPSFENKHKVGMSKKIQKPKPRKSPIKRILTNLKKANSANERSVPNSSLFNKIEDSSFIGPQKKRRIAHKQNEVTRDEEFLSSIAQNVKNKRRKTSSSALLQASAEPPNFRGLELPKRLPSSDPTNLENLLLQQRSTISKPTNFQSLQHRQMLTSAKSTNFKNVEVQQRVMIPPNRVPPQNQMQPPSQNLELSQQALPVNVYIDFDEPTGKQYLDSNSTGVRQILKKQKFTRNKCKVLFRKLMNYSTEEKALIQVCEEFSTQDVSFVAALILDKVSYDVLDKPDNKHYPAPLMTETQRILLGFMSRLSDMTGENIFDEYLTLAKKRLLFSPVLREIEPITLLYLAICKYRKDIDSMRNLCFDGLYFMNNYAVPLFFTVLKSWSEVLPKAGDSDCEMTLIGKVFVQIILTRDCNRAGYNFLPLRDMLVKYYGYPIQPWDCNEIFKEILAQYLRTPARPSDALMLLFCKNMKSKETYKMIEEYLKPIGSKTTNENFKATVIIMIGNIVSQFKIGEDQNYINDIEDWLEDIRSNTSSDVVQRSINLSLSRLPQFVNNSNN